ncbi:hypothetical protein SBOR_6740 [Sclerotinia borealis F-4128]|uniref:Mid2 domain-containing protein n=1 Tax=Sclerotinia borealis (strain F-4128) TaxID=1432307 RepID=W9C816_SCLBF|nr:hypothetical protein SBOR_6740 [Sclerotinia borealis F-4128]
MTSLSDPSSAVVSLSTGTTMQTITQTIQGYTESGVIVTHTHDTNTALSNGVIVSNFYKSWGPEDIVVAPTTQTITIPSLFTSQVSIPSSTSILLESTLSSLRVVEGNPSDFEPNTTPLYTSAASPTSWSSRIQSTLAAYASTVSTFSTASSIQIQSKLAISPPTSTSSQIQAPNTSTSSSSQQSSSLNSIHSGVILGGIIGGFAFICLFTTAFYLLRVRLQQQRHSTLSPSTDIDNESKFPEIDDEKNPIRELMGEGKISMRNDRHEVREDMLAELAAEKDEGGRGSCKLAELE